MQISPDHRLPTGNDLVSIPSLSAGNASAPEINVLSMRFNGLVEFHGNDKAPFFKPWIKIGPKTLDLGKEKRLKASRLGHWVPRFNLDDPGKFSLEMKVVAPLGGRGFFLEYAFKNLGSKAVKLTLGAEGVFAGMRVASNERYPLAFWRRALQFNGLGSRHLVLMAGSAAPEFALAIGASEDLQILDAAAGKAPQGPSKWTGKTTSLDADAGKGLHWRAARELSVGPGETRRLGIYFGLGMEAISAAATAVDMRRQGLEHQVDKTLSFLERRVRFTGDSHLDQVMNLNFWFNYFFAMGVTLDTEEFVCLTSRSPHYYVNGAYWDRDSMLWSFPAVLAADAPRARRMLQYAFGIQGRNIGVHSRFLNGAVLEPGFELDELCAPVIALADYIRSTGDSSLLREPGLRGVLRQWEKALQAKKHPSIDLYETLSGPDDDFEPMPYLCYDNVLAWKAQLALADLKPRMGREQDVEGHRQAAERIRSAIWKHLCADGPRGRMFVWASDLRGNHRFYTSPPGCLQLLPYFGFCPSSETVWRNTVNYLHSPEFPYSFAGLPFAEIGCAHAVQPWTLSICNSLLSGRQQEARRLLEKMEFDGGVACEAFHSKTGKPFSGLAFATCAGFLSFAMNRSFGRPR